MTAQRADRKARMAAAAAARTGPDPAPAGTSAVRTAPARVTLNLPPAMLREIERWALDAAETLMLPRVSTQDALRAMIRAALTNEAASAEALGQLRDEDNAQRWARNRYGTKGTQER